MSAEVVTRFAPSPTGFLHIGGARTALFNWLFARANGGRYLLRIEDTDRARSTQPAVDAIIEGLAWLGLETDAPPVFQHTRADRHRAVVDELLERGAAYRCYATPQELEEMREVATAEGRPALYDRRWRDRDPGDAPAGVAPAIRLRAPLDGETVVRDTVQGDVTFQNANLDDLVLLRSDGTPTYMLAVVVDDHDMGVTHVVRGDDHLNNAARQSLIFDALGWPRPTFAHIPLIHGPDGKKLSKRHGALGIEAYRAMGYLPETMLSYLARLGWSHRDQEVFSQEELISHFSLEAIGKAPARLDFDKLASVNAHFIRASDPARLVALFEEACAAGWVDGVDRFQFDETTRERMCRAMPALTERATTIVELGDKAGFIFAHRPIEIEPKASKLLSEQGRAYLAEIRNEFAALHDWTSPALEAVVKRFAESREVGLGKIAQPIRGALTGTPNAPGIYDCLYALGREESLARIDDQATTSTA
ncbi:MAG: glutamate--tRNA ligase [Pseudomonadota bacterium]